MNTKRITFAAATLGGALLVCALSASADVARQKGIEPGDLNREVDACTDFHEFANGTWRAANPIPAGQTQWSRRVAARVANSRRVLSILEDVARRSDWPQQSAQQLAGDHYAACMNEPAVETAGITPLKPLLAAIDSVRTPADVQRSIRRLHDLAIPVAFSIKSATDNETPHNIIADVVAGGLGLPSRDHYLKSDAQFAHAREAYVAHVARMLQLAGTPEAQAKAAAGDILALETRLAEASLDSAKASDQAATYRKTTLAELRQLAPRIDWNAYFTEAKLANAALTVAEPDLLRKLDKELGATPVATWRAYLKWQLLDAAAQWLSRPFAEASFDFRDKYLKKAVYMKPRAERCAESVEANFGDALGRLYVDRHFPPAAKAKAQEIGRHLLGALRDVINEAQWMQADTRRVALAKVADTNLQLGYPDQWADYRGVTVRRDALWANIAAARRFNTAEDRKLIGKPVNRSAWALPASAAGAYIDLQLNKAVLPAGFLQPPYFNPDATDAVNYGALGIGLAHDLTHAVDVSGSEVDLLGRPRNWWTDADRAAFAERSQCVADQFANYFVAPGVAHDGKCVLSEAIADLAGVRVAWLALKKSMQQKPVPVVDGFTPDQQFFISWGQTSGAAMSVETERVHVGRSPHPVPRYRLIGPLSNTPAFAETFSCKPNAPMVRPPEKRCVVW